MWDERYGDDEYVYGTEPNDFLREMTPRIEGRRVLCLAAGEGRNAVWLARQGHDVTAVDASAVGLAKARRLAEEVGVTLTTVHTDLADYQIAPGHWDAITSIFAHVAPPLRRRLHRQVVAGLAPGGVFVLEAYRPAQLAHGTGGPPTEALMMTLDGLREELAGLELEHGVECERTIQEGRYHDGTSAVVQVLARQSE